MANQGKWEYAEFSAERKAQEPGDFYSDITKMRKIVGWQPTTSLEDGLAKTIEFYGKHRDYYWSKPKGDAKKSKETVATKA